MLIYTLKTGLQSEPNVELPSLCSVLTIEIVWNTSSISTSLRLICNINKSFYVNFSRYCRPIYIYIYDYIHHHHHHESGQRCCAIWPWPRCTALSHCNWIDVPIRINGFSFNRPYLKYLNRIFKYINIIRTIFLTL